ncbi:MAG TPA: MFS transporter [Planctomycetaceae bacterium]|nr:MFS transporter [Planctomycetaceae bacterium]
MRLLPPASRLFHTLSGDGWLLFATRGTRMFAYGFLSVVLLLYLKSEGLSEERIGLLLTMTLLGDVVISLWITTAADRIGRKRMLILGACLMAMVGVVFALTANFLWLVVAATIGVLSPSDKEVGPFLSIEQAALSQTVADDQRTAVFAWYNLVGSVTAAFGALVGGFACQQFLRVGTTGAAVYRPLVVAYGIVGVFLALGFTRLSPAAESRKTPAGLPQKRWLGLYRSRSVVLRLSALFALDAFGGGFILQSIVAYWFYVRFHLDPAALGSLFFVANLFAAASALGAAALANRFGLINTMVFTHLPSNVLLILVPLMPTVELAVGVLLVRFCISQMDVPTRQSYTMAVVHPDERSAASGITTVARSVGAALSPILAGYCLADSRLISFPFFIAGGVKIVYDIWLYRAFVAHDPDAVPEFEMPKK